MNDKSGAELNRLIQEGQLTLLHFIEFKSFIGIKIWLKRKKRNIKK